MRRRHYATIQVKIFISDDLEPKDEAVIDRVLDRREIIDDAIRGHLPDPIAEKVEIEIEG